MRRGWKVAATLGGFALGWTAWEAVRLRAYRREGVALVALAERFPRLYTAGRGPVGFLVALGDSTAAGVGASRVEETLPFLVAEGLRRHLAVTNLAVSGAALADVLREQFPRFPHRPGALVVVSISANDATQGTNPVRFERDLRRLLDALRRERPARVVLTTTPNFRTTPALPSALNALFARRARSLAAVIERVTAGDPLVRLADLNRLGTLPVDEYAADGFHPSPEGYRRWAAVLVGAAHEP